MTESWHEELRAKGYRLTPQRELVLRAVQKLGHATPDEVLKEVHSEASAVNISTIYRNLELLEELGLVRHSHITDRAPTYHSTTLPPHVHLVCRSCHAVLDASPEEVAPLTDALLKGHGFHTDVGHLTVFGTCKECAGPSASLGEV
ncbi:MAG TPA: transcriptional repressor [Nocardioidaceae bacterium]|nr:transcriptional repressor [Nocardioidaceae bacterium]